MNKTILEVAGKLRCAGAFGLRDQVAVVVVYVAGRAGADKTIVWLITISSALV